MRKKPDQPVNHPPHPAPLEASRNLALPAAVVVLAACVVGGAVAITLSSKEPRPQRVAIVTAPRVTETSARPSVPRPRDDSAAIEELFRSYYGAVAEGQFDRAWSLLTPSYKTWKAGNGGRSKWESLEADNQEHLNQAGVRVRAIGREPSTGATVVKVTGMVYTRPGANPCAYEGVTWVRKVGQRWLYDQGYLQDPERARVWRPKRFQTLGYPCTPSGY